MEPVIRDEIIHALKDVIEGFYGKKLEPAQIRHWLAAVGQHSPIVIRKALNRHICEGTYAPRPKEILEYISEERQHKAASTPPPEENLNPAPKEIHDAWVTFIRITGEMEFGYSSMEFEEAVTICNREAFRLGIPDAIPDEYKIPDIWRAAA